MNVIFTSPDPVPIVNVNYSSNQITSPAAVDPDCLHSFLCLCLFQIGHKDFRSVPVANSFIYHKKYYIFFKLHAYKLAKIYPQSLSEHIVICDTCSLCFHQVRLEVWENLKKLWKHSPVSSCSHRISCSHKLPLVSECFFWGTIGW